MSPDISYIVRIDKKQKEIAIKELKLFCVNTDDYQFDQNLITEDCLITFKVNDEESTKWFKSRYEFSRKIKGKTLIGSIQLWISNHEAFCDFEFWAVSSSVGQACLDSKNLKTHLIDFVKKVNGQSLKHGDASGYIETIFDNENLT